MPMVPGTPGANLPPGDDELIRRIQELERTQREMLPALMAAVGPAITTLQAQQLSLEGAVSDLASRVTQTATIATFNTGSLPNDATFHTYGSPIPITIAVPTGKIVVTVGCGQATVAPDVGSVVGEATFSLSDGSVAFGAVYARGYATSPTPLAGSSLAVTRAFVVTPGTYTITGQMRAWANSTAAGSVNFGNPYLTVQVTG